MYRIPGAKPEVMFTSNEQLLDSKTDKKLSDEPKSDKCIPRDHKFCLTGPGDQSLCVFSRESANGG